MQFDLETLASKLNAKVLSGDANVFITGLAGVDTAEPGDLVFAEGPKYLEAAVRSQASAVLVSQPLGAGALAAGVTRPMLVVDQPRAAFVQALRLFAPPLEAPPGINQSARIGDRTTVGAGVHVGPNVVVGDDTVMGDGVVVMAGASIGSRCRIGAGTVIHPNAVLYPGVTIGRACILHAGCVIGADGFGYVQIGHGLVKVPHLGTVEIGDEVEIGANTCVDRAKTGVTRIGSGTKIDNLVHIAHNVSVGQACLIIAQAGVAGSVTIGNGVVLAGQAGIKDHVTLGDGARVAAQGGVIGDVAAGVTVSGYPARPHHEKMRELGALTALPQALKRIRALEKQLSLVQSGATTGGAPRPAPHASGDPGVPVLPEEADRGGFESESGSVSDVGPVG